MRLIFITLAAWMLFAIPAHAGSQEDSIRHHLKSMFERPDAPLTVDPIVIVKDHAIAGWSQDGKGGRALLQYREGAWAVVLCSGDGIRSAKALRDSGVPDADATLLAEALAKAEGTLKPEQLNVFSKFQGTMVMDPSTHHSHAK